MLVFIWKLVKSRFLDFTKCKWDVSCNWKCHHLNGPILREEQSIMRKCSNNWLKKVKSGFKSGLHDCIHEPQHKCHSVSKSTVSLNPKDNYLTIKTTWIGCLWPPKLVSSLSRSAFLHIIIHTNDVCSIQFYLYHASFHLALVQKTFQKSSALMSVTEGDKTPWEHEEEPRLKKGNSVSSWKRTIERKQDSKGETLEEKITKMNSLMNWESLIKKEHVQEEHEEEPPRSVKQDQCYSLHRLDILMFQMYLQNSNFTLIQTKPKQTTLF